MANVVTETVEETLERGDGRDGPVAQQGNTAAVGCSGLDGATDLHSEAYGLSEQDRNQDKNIFVACDEGFHALAMIICELTRARR